MPRLRQQRRRVHEPACRTLRRREHDVRGEPDDGDATPPVELPLEDLDDALHLLAVAIVARMGVGVEERVSVLVFVLIVVLLVRCRRGR